MNFLPEPDQLVASKPFSFTFSTVNSEDFAQPLVSRLSNLHNRIDRLLSEATVDGQPLLGMIIKSFPEADIAELERAGRALERVAKLLPEYKALMEKVKVTNYIRQNPEFIASMFGSFEEIKVEDFIDTPPTS